MRLACLELRQVWLVYRVLRQVNQFYLAPVRRTKVPARLFHQTVGTLVCGSIVSSCYATIALIWVTANCMLQSLSTLKSPSVFFFAPLQLCDSLKS